MRQDNAVYTCFKCGRRFDGEVLAGDYDLGIECPSCSNPSSVSRSRFRRGRVADASDGPMISPVENARLKAEVGRLRRCETELKVENKRLLSEIRAGESRQAVLEKEIEVERLLVVEWERKYELLVAGVAVEKAKRECRELKAREFRQKPM